MALLKYVLAALLIGFAWTAVTIFHLPRWVGIAVSALQVLVAVAIYLVRRFRAKRAARKLELAISAQGDVHARAARPEQQGEVVALKSEFLKAVGALKASRLGRSGVSALYALPWYVIIGPPGAGKSTALRNSGLNFPYLSPTGGAVRGIGGTRNCDWWLTNEAIILDTAGRYTSDDEDREEWLAFLDLLRTNRPRKPVNGILVAVSITEVAGASDEEVGRLAQRLRERIDEVIERLQIVPPVYLLLTKCDLIEGFVDTFGDLKKADRGQIWGFTMPVGVQPALPLTDLFTSRFAELLDNVHKRAMRLVGQERRIEAREKIYGFPHQFSLLGTQLGQLVTTLFAGNVYKETPIVRGVYFTSGTQEGRPIDRVMSAMAEAFGVAPQLPAAEPVTEAKSYFLRDVFAQVVFPDKNMAVRTRFAANRQRYRLYAVGAAIFGLALMLSSLPVAAYRNNSALISSTADIVGDVAARRSQEGAGPLALDKLEPLRQRVAELRRWDEDGAPAAYRFGLYRGDDLLASVSTLYADVLRKDVLAPIVRKTLVDLEAYAKDPEGAYDPGHYSRLKLYLLLSSPREPGEPALEGKLLDWVVEQIVSAWAVELAEEPTPERLEAMKAHARLYATLAAGNAEMALPRDRELVQHVRVALVSVPLDKVVLDPLIAEMSAQGYDLTLARILGSASAPVQSKAVVRGAFTRRAWEQVLRGRLKEAGGLAAPWVLGPQATRAGTAEQQTKVLRARYFELYIQEWQAFLASLRVKQASSPIEALAILQDLSRGVPPPYGRLIREIAFNTHLEEEGQGGLLDKGADKAMGAAGKKLGKKGAAALGSAKDMLAERKDDELGPEDVEAAFLSFTSFGVPPPPPPPSAGEAAAPPPQVLLDVYQEQLEFVRDALRTYLENPADGAALAARLQEARTRVKGLIEQQDIGWRPRFEALLWPPIEGASVSTVSAMASGKGLPWCNEVVVPFDRALKGRYPFNPNGHDAALADLADFYNPEGIVWTFFEGSLSQDIQRVGEAFEFSRRLGGASGFSSSLLGFLTRSYEITSVLFPARSKEPLVEFEVRIYPSPGLSQIVFEVDGQTFKTQNEPDRWQKMRWPGDGKVKGAAIRVKGAQNLSETLRQDGEWGLFRLIEQGKVEAGLSSRNFKVTWALSSRPNMQVVFDIRPMRNESPFFGLSRRGGQKLLAPFRRGDVNPPHSIARGGGCAVR